MDGLRRVIAMQYTSPLSTTLPFFPAVLKTLSHPTSTTRPLVYAYLLHHAEADPDTALLAINTIQKSLSDTNPRVRAMALKTMSGIRVPVISQIVSLAIKKGVADMSPVVRKSAAFACVKCVRLDPTTLPQITDYIAQLLGDSQYYVAGAAVTALLEVCPERLDLIHQHYRALVRQMVDMDEWGQIATLKLLTIYARSSFPYRTRRVKKERKTLAERAQSFYDEEAPTKETDAKEEMIEERALDPDLELFLNACSPLLQSRTSAVILSVVQAFFALAPDNYLLQAVGPLVALLRAPSDIRLISLYNIVQVALSYPKHFVPYYRHFTLHQADPPQVFRLKLETLTLIFSFCSQDQQSLTLAELEHFSRSFDHSVVREAVRAIGRCAQASSVVTSSRCLKLLLRQIHAQEQILVGEALDVIRHLIQQNPQRHQKTVVRLAKNLDTLRGDKARASVIWLVGEFAGLTSLKESVAPDVLRILIRGYADEGDEVRAQIVLLAAKVYLLWLNERNSQQKDNAPATTEPESKAIAAKEGGAKEPPKPEAKDTTTEGEASKDPMPPPAPEQPLPVNGEETHAIERLWQHTLLLARYTPDYDLRDRARLFRALLSVPSSTELASLLLLAPKPVPLAPSPGESRRGLALGSATLIIGDDAGVAGIKGYEPLPEWVAEGAEPDPRLRSADVKAGIGPGAPKAPASRALDDALRQDEGRMAGAKAAGVGVGAFSAKEKTLDSWLAESDGEEEDDDDDEESGTESESEEDDEEEESGSEEETDEEGSEEEEEGDERKHLVKQ